MICLCDGMKRSAYASCGEAADGAAAEMRLTRLRELDCLDDAHKICLPLRLAY